MSADPQSPKMDARRWLLRSEPVEHERSGSTVRLVIASGPGIADGEPVEVVPTSLADELRRERDRIEDARLAARTLAEVRERERDALRAEVERHSKRLRNIWALAARMWSESHVEEWGDVLTMIDGDWPDDEALTTIDRLQARIKELEGEKSALLERGAELTQRVIDAAAEGARTERRRVREWAETRRRPMGAYEIVRTAYNAALDDLDAWLIGKPEPSPERDPALVAVLSEEARADD